MSVADKACFENRIAPVFLQWRRSYRAHEPARFRRAGIGLCAKTQEKGGDSFLRAGERQPPACHQIENFRLAWNLDDDGTQGCTGERIICRPKAIRCIADAKQQHASRINSKFKKPGCRKLAEFEGGKILTNPKQMLTRGHAGSEPCRETGCCRFMAI